MHGCGTQRRPDAEQEHRERGDGDCEGQYRDLGCGAERVAGIFRGKPDQDAPAPGGQRDAEGSAGDYQQDALGEGLADESGAGGAERKAQGDFLLACRATRQQQVGDVGACNQQ